MQYTPKQLAAILERHRKWRAGEAGGVRANLREANLRGADLWGADLRGANLIGANLHVANLSGANLTRANLHGADLWGADLRDANLRWANLTGVNGTGVIGIRLITIHLSPYSLTYRSDTDQIHIGCQCMSAEDWLGKAGREIAKQENMSKEQTALYRESVKYLKKVATLCK